MCEKWAIGSAQLACKTKSLQSRSLNSSSVHPAFIRDGLGLTLLCLAKPYRPCDDLRHLHYHIYALIDERPASITTLRGGEV